MSRKRKKEDHPEQAPKPTKKPRRLKAAISAGVKRVLSRNKKRPRSEDEKGTPELGDQTKCQHADELYKSKFQSAVKKGVLNILGSGLSTEELDRVGLLRKKLKGPVKIKLCDSLSKKINLCLIPPHAKQPGPPNLVASSRTLKAMRAMLAGIPIVSTKWLESCLHTNNLLPPDPSMYIRTLPAKVGSNVTDFGVALQSALIQLGSIPKPLESCSVYLCGNFPRKVEGDIITLSKDSGATILKQRKAAITLAGSGQNHTLVLICSTDSDGSFNQSFEKAIKENPNNVVVVTPQWLFDSVSSVEFQDARSYPPDGVSSQGLWKLTTQDANRGTDGFFGSTSL